MSKSSSSAESKDQTQSIQTQSVSEWSFEQALKRLEELVRRLEQGNVPLEQSLTEYAEAVELLRICRGKLDQAQAKIEILSGFDAEGRPVTKPFAGDAEMSLDEKREARSSRRSADGNIKPTRGARNNPEVDESGQLF